MTTNKTSIMFKRDREGNADHYSHVSKWNCGFLIKQWTKPEEEEGEEEWKAEMRRQQARERKRVREKTTSGLHWSERDRFHLNRHTSSQTSKKMSLSAKSHRERIPLENRASLARLHQRISPMLLSRVLHLIRFCCSFSFQLPWKSEGWGYTSVKGRILLTFQCMHRATDSFLLRHCWYIAPQTGNPPGSISDISRDGSGLTRWWRHRGDAARYCSCSCSFIHLLMELIFLGTGSNNPSPHRGASSLGRRWQRRSVSLSLLFSSACQWHE